jgi:hypothetical protein
MASYFWEIYHNFVIAPYSIDGGERPPGIAADRD